MNTYKEFFTDVLNKLGLPVSVKSLYAFYAVSTLEGLNNRFNPLNSVVPHGDSTRFNSVGVQDYKTFENGVAGTVELLQGSPWVGVVDAMRNKATTHVILDEFKKVYASWGSHPDFPANHGLANQPLGGGAPITPPHKPKSRPTPKPGHPPRVHIPKDSRTYTVKPNDTLWNIAGEVYNGQHGKWNEIAKANNIHKPWVIFPGEELLIP